MTQDENGQTALFWPAREGYEAVVQLLLEHGADVNLKDDDGQTALDSAIRKGHEPVIRLLKATGATE